jgi:hypothetical protein
MIALTVDVIREHDQYILLVLTVIYNSSYFFTAHSLAKSSSSRFPEDLDTSPYTCSTVTSTSSKTKCSERSPSNEKISTDIIIRTIGSHCGQSMRTLRCRAKPTSSCPSRTRESGYGWSRNRPTPIYRRTARRRPKATTSSGCPSTARKA